MIAQNYKSERGFTLIELLIVIGIIGILAGVIIAVINPTRMRNRAKDAVIKSTLEKMGLALAANYASNLRDPTWPELQTMFALTPCNPTNNSFTVTGVEANWGSSDYCSLPPGGFYYYLDATPPDNTKPGCIGTAGFNGVWYAIDRNGILKRSKPEAPLESMWHMCWEKGLDSYPNAD